MGEDEPFGGGPGGDKVWYQNPQGQTHTAKAKFRGPYGWVCDRGRGQPVVVNEGANYLGHKKARNRRPDHIGNFLSKRG